MGPDAGLQTLRETTVRRGRARAVILFLSLVVFGAIGASATAATPKPFLRFGVLPLESPVQLARMFIPLTAGMAKALHRRVEFVTAPNFRVYMSRVRRHEYDILYLNPLLFRRAEPYGYRAIARVAKEPFVGIVVVRKASPLHRLAPGLVRKRLAIGFPDPQAYAATVMVRRYLKSIGFDVARDFKVRYFGSQNSVLLAVASGLVDLGGTWPPALRAVSPSVRSELRVIARTPPQPQMAIAVSETMPRKDRQLLRNYLLSLIRVPGGKRVLRALHFPYGFAAASNATYSRVRP